MVRSEAGSGITGKKEHNILQTTKAWLIVLKTYNRSSALKQN
jgi:hypothetical protein